MIKIKKILLFSVLISFLVAPIASAQDANNLNNVDEAHQKDRLRKIESNRLKNIDEIKERRIKLQQEREEIKRRIEERNNELLKKREEIKEKIKERRELLSEKRKERISKFWERMVKKIEASFRRLSKIRDRIETRIALLEEKNKNIQTEEAKLFLSEADVKIAEGLDFIEAAKIRAEELIHSTDEDNPRQTFLKIKDLVKESVNKLREAREELKNAIRSIKAQTENHKSEDNDNDDDNNDDNSNDNSTTTQS